MSAVINVRTWQVWTLPRRALILVLSTYGLALLALALAPRELPTPEQWAFGAMALAACGLSIRAERRVGSTGAHGREATLNDQGDGWFLAAVLLCPEWMALLLPLAWYGSELLAKQFLRPIPGRTDIPFKLMYNAAMWSLASWSGARVWQAADGPATSAEGGWLGMVPAALGAGVALELTALVFLVSAVSLASGGRWIANARVFAREARDTTAVSLLGIAVAAAWMHSPATIVVAFPLFAALQRSMLHSALLTSSRTDGKTGLINAEFWRQSAEAEIDRAVAGEANVSVLVVDLDHFKRVNDTHGHLVGDDVLIEIAERLRNSVRSGDLVGRFGGEEFVVLLPETSSAEAVEVAERIRATVAATPVRSGETLRLEIRCSIGAASVADGLGTALSDVLAAADAALYEAKEGGRDQVRVAAGMGTA